MKRAPTSDIVWLFLATRLVLVLVTYVSYILLTAHQYSTNGVDAVAFFTSWNRWDAANYVRIAEFGYQTQFDVAFFPLFPLLISILGHPFGHWGYLVAGTLISNAALLGALFVMYQLVADREGDQVARRTLLYLCIFPTAFFFFAPYNESLFLFLTAATFLAMRRQRWWLAGLLGFLAALTRSAGILLVVPYLYEVWVSQVGRRTMLLRLLPVGLIPLGTALYCIYCWQIRGDPFAFATLQYHWGRQLSWPWQGLWQSLFQIFWQQPFGSFYEVHTLLDLSATIAFITLTIVGWRTLRMSYNLWLLLLVVYVLLSPTVTKDDPLISNQRFILEMFPIFITLASLSIKHPRLHQALYIIFPALLATLSILFITNHWMV
jgi:Gpi18-like mannosyltransferase